MNKPRRLATILATIGAATMVLPCVAATARAQSPPEANVAKTDDFEVTGDGANAAWQKAKWIELQRRDSGQLEYRSCIKLLYSDTGLYVLFHGTDARLTASDASQDFDDLWLEDVFELFLWTDPQFPVYFEYEISPLNKELPILIPNFEGKFLGWRPWNYEGERRVRKAVHIIGGAAKPGSEIKGWQAEVFVPFALLAPLQQVPPRPGTKWRANFYRVDYDEQRSTAWYWAAVGSSFHEHKKFGTLVFQ